MSGNVVSDADRTKVQGGRAAVEAAAVNEYHRLWAAAVRMLARCRPGLPSTVRRDEAADVVQEAISRALAKADQCQRGKSAGAWVMGFLVKILAERGRQARREERAAAFDPALDADHLPGSVPDLSVVDRDGPLFDVALAGLRPADRAVLELLRDEDLTSRELARRLGLPSDGAARVARHRALAAVKTECRRLAAERGEEVIP
jgi:DNA-directed RNA polymerase specialized sigma24 family protein